MSCEYPQTKSQPHFFLIFNFQLIKMFSDELEKISWEETTKAIYSKTDADVRRALGKKEHLDVNDFMALISPAATPYLEVMARLSQKYTMERFGKTISMFVPLYITNSCTNSCVYCGFHISNPMKRTILTEEEIVNEYKAIKRLALKEKVRKAAKDLNYKHNSYAANLRMGISKTIGVIVPHINKSFFSELIAGIEEICFEHDYGLIICQSQESYEKECRAIDTLIRQNVDGILISVSAETNSSEHLQNIINHDTILIQIDRFIENFPGIQCNYSQYCRPRLKITLLVN